MTTKSKELVSNFPVPPGMVLEQELEARGVTPAQLAQTLGISRNSLGKIIKGQKAVTAEIALDLERILDGLSAQFWLNLESKYQLTIARNRRNSGTGD